MDTDGYSKDSTLRTDKMVDMGCPLDYVGVAML
jgi:hypothetical protein